MFAAENPKRDLYVGGAAKLNAAASHYTPRLADKYSQRFAIRRLRTDQPKRDNSGNNLHEARGRLRERQGHNGPVFESSVYTLAAMYTKTTLVVIGAIGLIALATVYQKYLRRYAPALGRQLPSLQTIRHRLPDLRHRLPLLSR